ncbi:MAG: molecular chaperone HtpG [Proteobacteria bacterium]|nr:molecular chaperone HtpG [Pseudomonadota bacterium]
MAEEKLPFQAEVSRLLDIVAHALYSDKEVFLRELISNASDACDRLRYLTATEPELAKGTLPAKITLIPEAKSRTLEIVDTGIGMGRDELVENLGTIARSGTGKFLEQLTGDAKTDLSLIGQFGVGFYASFMVAEQVEVVSRKVGSEQAWRWTSDGKGAFTVAEAVRDDVGTSVKLHLNAGEHDFLEPERLKAIVRRYSDHIGIPIALALKDKAEETINSAAALWTRSKSEITPEQSAAFYKHVAHASDEPYVTVHVRAEGTLEYSALLYVPSQKPFDLFHPDRKHGVKLYVRRVFITDDCKELVPGYLRFLRGVVDSSDLPLNVSREMLQNNPLLAKIRANLVKRVLAELEKKSAEDGYPVFWDNFGPVLKEGLYEDYEQHDVLLKLARFRTTVSDAPISLETYVGRMKPGQDAIYTISGEDAKQLQSSPQLEGYRAKGVEVLLLTDPIDEFWMPMVQKYGDKPFRSVTRGAADLSKVADAPDQTPAADKATDGEIAKLIALFKLTLGDEVKDVRESNRLTDSAVCLVADEGDIDMRLEKLLRQHKQLDKISARVLELNPRHPVIRALIGRVAAPGASDSLADAARLLLDQARILEGETLPDPRAFARRLDGVLAKGLGGTTAA